MASGIGIDDEAAIHALVDMAFQRQRMAVIEMAAEGVGIEDIFEHLAWLDEAGAGDAVHAPGVDAVEMHGVRMGAAVLEADAQALALATAQCGAGDAAGESPGWEHDAGGHFHFLVDADDFP